MAQWHLPDSLSLTLRVLVMLSALPQVRPPVLGGVFGRMSRRRQRFLAWTWARRPVLSVLSLSLASPMGPPRRPAFTRYHGYVVG